MRRISSPPTVFSHIFEPQPGASPGGGGGGTPLEVLRSQIWPEPEPQQQQTQHTRLKKKFEDLKKRHGQDKDEWMHQKELLLREVADIQGGENRRILLDLKCVLEEVQGEVKREEEKRSDLQLEYTRDRCGWELERAELKCRIAQLEARDSGGVPGSVTSRETSTSTFRREREEQRRLLADTRSAAMDLRCRLEHNERDWSKEKAEMLERFDMERREWESQLRDMQRKIEGLYCEVRAKREGTILQTGVDSGTQDDDDVALRLSIHSTSTGSSLRSDQSRSEPLSSSSLSEVPKHLPFPGFFCHSNIGDGGCGGRDSHRSSCFQENSFCELTIGGQLAPNDRAQPENLQNEPRPRDPQQRASFTDSKEAVDTAELEAILQGAPGCAVPQRNTNTSKGNVNYLHVGPLESPRTELSYSSDRKKNTTALNAALKEIARVSEELCSYQDEIRKKTGDKRNRSESLYLPEEREMLLAHVKTRQELEVAPCDFTQIYDDLQALEKEYWITMTPDNASRANSVLAESWRSNSTGPDSHRDNHTTPTIPPEMDTDAPPVPPRTSSWSLGSPTPPEPELHIQESSMNTGRRCHSPCVLVDRKCSSPSIVRKFEAMLQENEGKVLAHGVVASCSVPSNSNCNVGCCHNRWSCDASKFSNSKLSTYMPAQKSFSEVNILTAVKDSRPNCRPTFVNLKRPEGHQLPPMVKELPVDLLLPSLGIPPACPNLQGSKRNIMLEQKTAEFNRTLFQAEMGRGVEDSFTPTDASSFFSDEVPPPKDTNFDLRPQCTEVTSGIINVHPQVTLAPSTSDPTFQNPEVRLRETGSDPQGQGVKPKQEVPRDLSPQESEVWLREATTSVTATHHSEVKHKAQTPSSPSRKTQHTSATETLFSEPLNPQAAQNVAESNTKKENPGGGRPHPAKVGASTQQASPEARLRQTAQPRHTSLTSSQSDTPRPGPRVMTDHPWKPLTLAAYPRPEGSRSNYGAVEKILKSYESAALQNQSQQQQQQQLVSSPNLSPRQEENVSELLGMLDMDPPPLPPLPRHTHFSHTSQTHTTQTHTTQTHTTQTHATHAQLSSHSAMGVKEMRLTVQKSFSRPARPANRRLPTRWASRSPSSSSSSSSSSSPSTTPVVPPPPPPAPLQKHSSSFAYSHTFHMETVII